LSKPTPEIRLFGAGASIAVAYGDQTGFADTFSSRRGIQNIPALPMIGESK